MLRASFAAVTRGCAALSLLVVLALAPAPAAADAWGGDGLYGRFDGDVWLGAALGGGAALVDARAGQGTRGTATFELRARFLDSVGPFSYVQVHDFAGETRAWQFGGGVEIRPLFLARFLTARSLGSAWLDVLIDSLGLEVGVAALGVEARPRAALVVGGGLEVPLVLGAPRVSLRLGVRWVHADADGAARAVGNEVSLLGALVIAAPVTTGLAGRAGPRARPD